jgi:BirA family biotin operon repressor/biotin-[acetyl-CoA-carboxylase] ligase
MKIGNSIVSLKTVGSTNQYLLDLISKNKKPADGELFLSHFQTQGQGMGSNNWESEAGKNLTFSIYLETGFLQADMQFLLNKAVSLAIFDFVKEKLPMESVSIKWPNDIYIHDNKVAGILIQHTIQGNTLLNSVVGIGINFNQLVFQSDAPNPVSIVTYLKDELNLKDGLNQICIHLNKRFGQLTSGSFFDLNNDYLNSLYRYNTLFEYKISESGTVFRGRIIGVNEYGQLWIKDIKGNVFEFGFKEVEFLI